MGKQGFWLPLESNHLFYNQASLFARLKKVGFWFILRKKSLFIIYLIELKKQNRIKNKIRL